MKHHGILKLLFLAAGCAGALSAQAEKKDYLAEIQKHERNRNRPDAIAECRRALEDKTLDAGHHYRIALHMASNATIAKDYELAAQALELAAHLPSDNRRQENAIRLDAFRRSSREHRYPVSLKIGLSLLDQADHLTGKQRAEFYPLLIWTAAKTNSPQALARIAKAKSLPEENTLELRIIRELAAAPSGSAPKTIGALPEFSRLSPEVRHALLQRAASALLLLNHADAAEAVLAEARKLETPFRRNSCTVKAQEPAPPGAGGWILSDAWTLGGSGNFIPYDQAAEATLAADATAERLTGKKKNLDFYLKNTRFHLRYDSEGVHLFLVSGENDLEKYRSLNTGAGSLEIFLSPGMEREDYYQFIISLPDNRIDCYEKGSFSRHYRDIRKFMKSETLCRDGKMGTYVFLPWIFFYDVLPFDTNSSWRFGVIRWTPAGGITWGGRVHELGRMGKLVWEEPDPVLKRKIREKIAEHGIAKYSRDKGRLLEFWNDPDMGDRDFARTLLAPAFRKLDEAIAAYRSGKMTPEAFAETTLPDLMETDFLAEELRGSHLMNKFTGNSGKSSSEQGE